LISDLKKLANFPDSMKKRAKELDKLNSGGLKRRMNLDSASAYDTITTSMVGEGRVPNFELNGSGAVNVWGTIRWFPNKLPSNSPLTSGMPGQMKRALLGLRADQITLNIWEALPWSWLVDYFTNFGDFLQATSGRSSAKAGACCIMKRYSWHFASTAQQGSAIGGNKPLTMVPATIRQEMKSRSVVYPTLEVPFPSLTGKQLSILGSLAALKVR
jgi:hypothetical protein